MRDIKPFLPFYIGQKMIYTGDGFPFRGTKKEEVLTIQNFELLSCSPKRKLLLRSLSDMTEEEATKFLLICGVKCEQNQIDRITSKGIFYNVRSAYSPRAKYFDLCSPDEFKHLIENGFDLFQLIPDDLALDSKLVTTKQ